MLPWKQSPLTGDSGQSVEIREPINVGAAAKFRELLVPGLKDILKSQLLMRI